jgi:hypothetical protein
VLLGAFPTGVTAVAALVDSHPMGITANSFTSVSLEPPIVLISVAHMSTTWPSRKPVPRSGNMRSRDDYQGERQFRGGWLRCRVDLAVHCNEPVNGLPDGVGGGAFGGYDDGGTICSGVLAVAAVRGAVTSCCCPSFGLLNYFG